MTAQPETLLDADERAWERAPASCDACGRTWLVAEREVGERCGCGQGRLQPSTVRMPRNLPEQAVPAVVSVEGVVASLSRHLARVRFRPKGMSAPDLGSRAVLVWWPRWMVDAWVRGAWGVEVGFDYEAHSTVEHYSGGTWVSKDQVDVRVRWEARTGTLERRYHNVVVPALRDEGPVARMGAADAEASPVQRLPDGRLLLPDQSPSEVWAAADEAFRARAADEVRRAASTCARSTWSRSSGSWSGPCGCTPCGGPGTSMAMASCGSCSSTG